MTQLSIVDKPKRFTWSYSKLKNYETCPRRHFEVDLLKSYPDETTPELDRGDRLHKAMHDRVTKKTPLPIEFMYMEKWAEKLTTVMHPDQTIQCELKLAITNYKKPCAFFDKWVWLRSAIDYLIMVPDKDGFYVSIVDYKTGKPKDDDTQLIVNALVVFANYPEVQTVRSSFLWTEYSDTRYFLMYRRDIPSSWRAIEPRVSKYEAACIAQQFPPNKCGLCRSYCPVVTCEHNGK